MSTKGLICPRCGRADSIEPYVRPLGTRDQLDVLFFELVGFLHSISERHSWLRCTACEAKFRRPTRAITFLIAAVSLSAALGLLAGLVAVWFERDAEAGSPAWGRAAFIWIGDHPVAAVVGAGVFILGLVSAMLSALCMSWRSRRRAWEYRRKLDALERGEGDVGRDSRDGS
jgi:hypothetical protein